MVVGVRFFSPHETARLTKDSGQQNTGILFVGLCLPGLGIVGSGQAFLVQIGLSRNRVSANIVGLEKRAEAVVLLLLERIVLVFVAPGASQGNSKESGG